MTDSQLALAVFDQEPRTLCFRAAATMDIRRPVPRDPGPPTIAIHNDDHRPFGARGPFSSGLDRSLSGPMGIPSAPSQDGPPPPLPPPRFVPVDGPQADHSGFFERQRKQSYSESFFGGRSESNYGSFGHSWRSRTAQEDDPDYRRRESASTPTGRDEGYSSLSSYTSSGWVIVPRHRSEKFTLCTEWAFSNTCNIGLGIVVLRASVCMITTNFDPASRMTANS